jgi:hypothetical protein
MLRRVQLVCYRCSWEFKFCLTVKFLTVTSLFPWQITNYACVPNRETMVTSRCRTVFQQSERPHQTISIIRLVKIGPVRLTRYVDAHVRDSRVFSAKLQKIMIFLKLCEMCRCEEHLHPVRGSALEGPYSGQLRHITGHNSGYGEWHPRGTRATQCPGV